MVLVGLRAQNFPNEAEKAVLLDFIMQNYAGHRPSEIKLAFTMAIQGKLELEKGFDVICYENFSVVYFAGIMNAYRSWAKEAVNFIPKQNQKLLTESEVSDEEFIKSILELYRQNKNYKLIPVFAYKILEKQGKIILTLEEKRKIVQHIHETTNSGNIKELSMQYAVKLYFDERLKGENI
jgi:hypothetical protein